MCAVIAYSVITISVAKCRWVARQSEGNRNGGLYWAANRALDANPAADLRGRGHDVTAGGTEVEVVAGQAAIVLVRASEVGVHSAGRGPYVDGGTVDQSGAAEPAEG